MRRGHLILIYFIAYVAVVTLLGLKLFTFEAARRQLSQIDLAIRVAGERTAEVLNNHVYEQDPETLIRDTFIYAYSFSMNEMEEAEIALNSEMIDSIYLGINGELVKPTELMNVTDSDSIAVYIVLKDFTIHTPFRSFVVSREYYRELDR